MLELELPPAWRPGMPLSGARVACAASLHCLLHGCEMDIQSVCRSSRRPRRRNRSLPAVRTMTLPTQRLRRCCDVNDFLLELCELVVRTAARPPVAGRRAGDQRVRAEGQARLAAAGGDTGAGHALLSLAAV